MPSKTGSADMGTAVTCRLPIDQDQARPSAPENLAFSTVVMSLAAGGMFATWGA
jgi:hypothetical protein